MIQDIFLPEEIRGYYLFAKRIVGLDIGKTHIGITQLFLKGRSIIVEKYLEEQIEVGPATTYVERAIKALQQLSPQLDPYDAVHVALSSSVAIFKELKLPFITHDKIKMVVHYEIEPLLPFAINDAVIDFIITQKHPEQGSSDVLVAAVQQQYIAQHMQICQGAGINPDVLTIDLFALYGLFKKIPKYANLQGDIALIDIGSQTTRMAYIQEGRLRFIRSISKGTWQQASAIAQALEVSPQEAMDHITRFGLEKNDDRYTQAISKALEEFWQDVQFTLQSFTAVTQQPLQKIILVGGGAEIKGLPDFIHHQLQIPCEIMHATDILHDTTITFKSKSLLPSSSIISLSTALPSPITKEFNLLQGEFIPGQTSLLNKQLIVAASLLLLLFGSFGLFSFWQIRKMSNAAHAYETEAINALESRQHLNKALQSGLEKVKEKDRLSEAIDISKKAVKEQEEMWFAFTGPARASMLKYLLELTTRIIDKDALGFSIDSLAIAEGVMTLKAKVKDHEALKTLEKELEQSTLFSFVPKQEETNFTMKIVLEKNGEGK